MATRTLYGFDEDGNKIAVGEYFVPNPIGMPVGGIVYYIDSTADGTYTFYNDRGVQSAAPTVGTDCTYWTYTVSGASKDKYYVYNENTVIQADRTGTESSPYLEWSYLDTTNQSYIDGEDYYVAPSGTPEWEWCGSFGRVYETLDGTYTGTAIGAGKSNTFNMLNLRNGVYNQGVRIHKELDSSSYAETIWYICDQFNQNTYTLKSNNTGLFDWYIPSKDELAAMVNELGEDILAGYKISSSACDIDGYWIWLDGYGVRKNYRGGNYTGYCLIFSRSF